LIRIYKTILQIPCRTKRLNDTNSNKTNFKGFAWDEQNVTLNVRYFVKFGMNAALCFEISLRATAPFIEFQSEQFIFKMYERSIDIYEEKS